MYNNSNKQQANPIARPPILMTDIHLFFTKYLMAILKFKENILNRFVNSCKIYAKFKITLSILKNNTLNAYKIEVVFIIGQRWFDYEQYYFWWNEYTLQNLISLKLINHLIYRLFLFAVND